MIHLCHSHNISIYRLLKIYVGPNNNLYMNKVKELLQRQNITVNLFFCVLALRVNNEEVTPKAPAGVLAKLFIWQDD